jgi:predicted MFS family arabinose efflux permease
MPFRSVFRRVLPYGAGLALGSAGFGSIATFITLYYASRHWSNAALSLSLFGACFVGTRLVLPNAIRTYGGFRVALVSFGFEAAGLLLLALAPSQALAMAGAALAGCGFALVFPALAVQAVLLVPAASRGAALSAYSVFLDVALGVTGPVAGLLAGHWGYPSVFLAACAAAAGAVALTLWLMVRNRRAGHQGAPGAA